MVDYSSNNSFANCNLVMGFESPTWTPIFLKNVVLVEPLEILYLQQKRPLLKRSLVNWRIRDSNP